MNFNKKTTTNMTLVTAALAAGLLTSPAMADREYRWAGPVWDGETQYCGWLPGWGSPDNWWWSNGIPNRPNDWANFRTNDVFGFTVIALGEGNVGYWNLDRIEISTDYRVHLRNCRGTAKFTFHSPSHLPFLKITGNGNHQIDTRVEYSPLGGIIRNSALLTFGEDSGFLFPSGAYGPLYLGNADPNDHGVTVFEGDASEWAGAEGEVIIIVGEDHTLEAGANDSLPNDGAVVVGFNGHLRIVDDETVGLISGEGDIQLYADLVFGGETRGALWSYHGAITGTGGLTYRSPDLYTLYGNNDYQGGTTITFGSRLRVADGGNLPRDAGDIVNEGNLEFVGADQSYINGNLSGAGTYVIRDGQIELRGDNTTSGWVIVDVGASLIGNSDNSTGTANVVVAGTLSGSGAVRGEVTLLPGSIVEPGSMADTAGRLVLGPIVYRVDLSVEPTFKIDLGGMDAGMEYDQIHALNLSLGGTLDLSYLNGFTASQGDSFKIITGGLSMEGRFENVIFPDNDGDWFIDYDVILKEVTVTKDSDCNGNGVADSRELEHPEARQDFDGGPGATYTMNGTAIVDNGSLRLTEAIGSQTGSVVFDTLSANQVGDFVATFDFKMGGGTGADGMSFAFLDANIHDNDVIFGEKGPGAGSLVVSLDTYEGGPDANFVEVLYEGVSLATVDVTWELDNDNWNTAMIWFRDETVWMWLQQANGSMELIAVVEVPDFIPSPARFGFGARTGGLTNEHRVDNVRFTDESNTNDRNNNGIPDQCEDFTTVYDLQMVEGALLAGTLADLLESDDAYVHTRSGFGVPLDNLHNMEMIVSAVTTADNTGTINLTIESRIDEPAGQAEVSLRNWNTNQFEQVGSYSIGNTDQVDMLNNIDATNYVDGAGNIDMSIKHLVFVPFFAFQFESFIDQVKIEVE